MPLATYPATARRAAQAILGRLGVAGTYTWMGAETPVTVAIRQRLEPYPGQFAGPVQDPRWEGLWLASEVPTPQRGATVETSDARYVVEDLVAANSYTVTVALRKEADL